MEVRRCGYALGAQIRGVDASKPLDATTVEAIRKAWRDHVVVYLPGQALNAHQFRDFCGRFGELDTFNLDLLTGSLPRHPDLSDVVVRANKPVAVNGQTTVPKSSAANKWHSDYSYSPRPSTMTFLLGKELPGIGGDTMFSNQYMAYETLSPALQRMLDPLEAVHDFTLGSGAYQRSGAAEQAQMRLQNPPWVHPLVQVHPETGRKSLFIAERLRNFAGMSEEETKPFLDFLMQHSTRYEFTYRHRWAVDDLVIWDNRCSLHYAVQDYAPEMRMLLRCSLLGPAAGHPLAAQATPIPTAVA